MERKMPFAPSEYYHIYNRGVDKRKIFLAPKDYQRFLSLLYLANTSESIHLSNLLQGKTKQGFPLLELLSYPKKDNLVAIGAFCLMPNHFHLLLRELSEGGISRFMLKLQTAYSMYFNKKNKRSGALVQGMFRSEYVDDDDYLKYLYAYIHLNPAKLLDVNWRNKILSGDDIGRFLDHVKSYPYSSGRLYLTDMKLPEESIVSRNEFPEYFVSLADSQTEIIDWLNYNTLSFL